MATVLGAHISDRRSLIQADCGQLFNANADPTQIQRALQEIAMRLVFGDDIEESICMAAYHNKVGYSELCDAYANQFTQAHPHSTQPQGIIDMSTFTFESIPFLLEQQLKVQTAMVQAIMVMAQAHTNLADAITGARNSKTSGDAVIAKAKDSSKAAKAATPDTPVTSTIPVIAKSEPASPSIASEIDYAAVSRAITAAVKDNRDHVVAALTKFGVKKGTELKTEQYAPFLAVLADC